MNGNGYASSNPIQEGESLMEKELEETKQQLSLALEENVKLRVGRMESSTIAERQQQIIHDLEQKLCQVEKDQARIIARVIREQTRSNHISFELEISEGQSACLRKQLKDMKHEAQQDSEVALMELDKLGIVAHSEINKLGKIIKELQAQKRNQANLITTLENRLREQALASGKIELELRKELAQEKSKNSHSTNKQSLGLWALRIAQEHDAEEGDPLIISPSVGEPGCLQEETSLGLSQASLLEGVIESKKRTSIWERLGGASLDADLDNNLNLLIRKQTYAATDD